MNDSMRPSRKAARMRWAALIQRVFEVDSLKCQHCGGTMKIIAFIERKDQPQVVERILKHGGYGTRVAQGRRQRTRGLTRGIEN